MWLKDDCSRPVLASSESGGGFLFQEYGLFGAIRPAPEGTLSFQVDNDVLRQVRSIHTSGIQGPRAPHLGVPRHRIVDMARKR